jgi:L-aspartate oxidase
VFDSEEGESAETKRFALTQEGAHRYPRILHAGGDQTGRHVMAHLLKQLQAQPLFTYSEGVELLAMEATEQGGYRLTLAERASQQLCRENEDETACVLEGMPSVVLATGGVGGLFAATTNTPFATGDALALARMLEVPLTDVPFVQFHPTAFVHQGQVRFLVSEALRGEGAILRNVRGEAFAKRYHPQGDLAPRDVVARMMIREIAQQQATDAQAPAHVFLDMTHRAPQWLEQRFPSIVAMAREYGVCPARQWLPVVPAAHYHMGGVATDVAGRTQRAGLFVVGEAACTGLHGANRLASNSLLECVIMGLNCADAIMTQASVSDSPLEMSPPMSIHPCVDVMTIVESGLPTVAQLQACVQESLGIERRRSVLVQAQNQLIAYLHTCQQVLSEGCSIAALRRQRQVQTALLLVEAALQTPQSLGAHCFVEDVFLPDSATSGMSS